MISPSENGSMSVDITMNNKASVNASIADDSFKFDAAPTSEQKSVNLDNYLALDNERPFTPEGEYNPATKKYIDDIIKNFKSLNIEKVNTLEEVIDVQTIYLIPNADPALNNAYSEYILIDGVPECIGITKVALDAKQNKLIAGDNVAIDENDIISAKGGVEPKTGEELALMEEPFTGVAFCTEGYGDEFSEGSMYEYENGGLIKVIELSGGASSNTNQSETITPLESNIAIGSEMLLTYNFKSKTSGKGTAKLFVGGVLKSTKSVERGENFFDVTQYVKEGSNYFTITITDSNNATATFDYIVNGIKLTLKTTFNENIVYTGDITFTYTVIGAGVKTVTFVLDDTKIGEAEVRSSGDQSKYTITGVTHGGHILKVKATTTLGDVTIDSNELSCRILYAEEGVTTPIISSSFNKTTAVEGESLSIDYLVYDPLNIIADVLLQVNDEEPTPAAVNRTKQYWSISKYPVGDVIFKISCRDSSLSFPVTVEELNIDIEPVEDDLSLFLTGANRSNAELEEQRQTWTYNDIACQLTNFNWVSNGWMNNALKMTGEARCFIPLNLFANDFKNTGKTIEIEFATRNIMNYNSILVSCYTEDKGLQISATEAFFKTEQEEVKVRFKEDEKLRLSFVIEASGDNRLIKTYINGVLSGLTQYDSSDNFQQGVPVGISINDGGEEIDIYTIRVYDIALSSRQILNNYICDLTDINEKMTKYQANNVYDIFGSIAMAKIKSMLPILTITGPLPSVKGDKQTISTTYSDPINPALNFETENCTLDIQGTSSQYYPKKNYKIKFPEKFSFYEGAIPEKEYTFKADYMESSHSHNTGNAILVNTLYDEMFPTQTAENGVRNTIYGFPCAIYYRLSEDYDYEYFGAYNFNNDKGNSDTLGLTGEKAQSWEFKNNTSEHCLLRNADFSPEAKPEDDFEARYPDKYTDYTDLERVVSWVLSTDGDLEKFKSEFSQHFNLHYCLVYYVMMEVALMMDSRAKNMFWDTIDGNIWYPRMYDMDTCYGLNNEGVLNFGYGLEQHDKDIYNGENSLFWNNFEECYAQEIKDMYLSLRSSGKISYDNLMFIFKEHQIDKICEAQYNEDAKFKYINPINEDNDTTYLYAAQGNRLSHFQWWVSNRLKYLDSKFEAPEYLADFITMRMYTKQGAITITPFTDQYLKIKYGSADVKIRATSGVPTLVPCPSGLEFNDTETIIYGANGIADIGDLSSKYPGTVDISRGLKLSKLKVGDSGAYENVHMTSLTVGNNPLLRSIDVSNCPNLTGNLNVSGCTALREFYAGGTGLRGVTFVDGGDLEKVVLPRTLTNLTIKNHMNIESFEPSSFENLQTLVLQNTNLNASGILSANYKNLTRVYCKFPQDAGVDLHTFILDYLVENCKGIDDNGANTDYPNIQGYISVSYPSTYSEEMVQDMKNRYATAFPYLEITYRSVINYFTYNASYNRVEFPVLTENLPATVLIPDADKIEPILGLAEGTINENTTFRIDHTSNSSYKNTVEHIILPEGYASYYINMEYFPNIKSFVFPKTKMKITYFNFNDSNSPYAPHIEELDFSAEGVDLTSCTSLKLNLTNGSLKRFSLKNKTLSGTTGIGGNSSNGMFYNMLTYSGTCSPIEEYNFENLKVTTAASDFGFSAYSSKQCKLKATNMQLDQMKALRLSSLYRAEEVDLSGTSAPKATALSVASNNSTQSSNYTKLIKLNNMYLPSLTSINNLCYYMMNLTELQMDSFSTDLVTNMSAAFYYCASMTDYSMLKDWNVENVTTMSNMFYYNKGLTEFILNWKTPNLQNLNSFIGNCTNLQNFIWNNENANKITDLSAMFSSNSKLQTVTMKGFNTSLVTNFSSMFSSCSELTDINDLEFNLDSATTMSNMFSGCKKLTNINFDINTQGLNLTSMGYMFNECTNIQNVSFPSLVGGKLTNISRMFYNCQNLETINLPSLTGENVSSIDQAFRYCYKLKNLNMQNFLGSKITATDYLFDQCREIEYINLNNFNAKITGSMAHMFNGCTKLKEIHLSSLDTSGATSMYYTFANMPNLEVLELGDNFSTKNVTNFTEMFGNTANIEYPIEKITFEKATTVNYMFEACNISATDWAKMTKWDFCNLTNLDYMFYGATLPEVLDFGTMNLSKITTFNLFNSATKGAKIVNVDNVVYQNGTNMWNFINSILNIKTLEHIDLTNCAMPMSATYSGYNAGVGQDRLPNLKTFILPNLELTMKGDGSVFLPSSKDIEVIKIKSVKSDWYNYDYSRFIYYRLFAEKTKLKEVYVESLDFPHANSNLYRLFYGCTSLEKFNMNSVDTTNNTRIDYMFYNCKAIENIDLSWMKTDNVNTMTYMFYGCSNLKTVNWDGFVFDKVTSLTSWFQKAGIENIVIDNIPYAPVLKNGTYMFAECPNLKTISFTDNVDFAQLTSLYYWFNSCPKLEYVDMSKLLLTNCTNFYYMFRNCTSLLEVDLSNITTAANVNAEGLFYGCSSLQKVDMRNWPINKITSYQYKQVMFDGVPADCLVIVKDESCRSVLNTMAKHLTNVVLASELEETE